MIFEEEKVVESHASSLHYDHEGILLVNDGELKVGVFGVGRLIGCPQLEQREVTISDIIGELLSEFKPNFKRK